MITPATKTCRCFSLRAHHLRRLGESIWVILRTKLACPRSTLGSLRIISSEGIQNIAGNNDLEPEIFYPYLKLGSAKWWAKLNAFWGGDMKALRE